MATLQVDTLKFDFESTVSAQIYDQWQHYSSVWNAPPGGQKAVDVIAVNVVTVEDAPTESTAWLIEAKDFRVITNPPKASNISGLAQFVTEKVQHTLAGLADASAKAALPDEKQLATDALACPTKRVVLHLEPHTGVHTALFPIGFAASVLQRLRQLVTAIDSNPLVLNIANTPASGVPWTAS
ncbi:MAG: hypothetical protein NTW21_36625 [Verrucomicrobia bacterium]|nr:hypothetical protein [Verrucomicrobiota bacterium]